LITLDATKGQATFTVEVRTLTRDPIAVHIHSKTNALAGGFPSLRPNPPRNRVATGTVSMSQFTILQIYSNVDDFYVAVHTASVEIDDPADLHGDLRRVPGP
jgi:hypothetical protein